MKYQVAIIGGGPAGERRPGGLPLRRPRDAGRDPPCGYPGASGGVQIYKGAGNNHSAGAASQAFFDLPNLNTRYFLSCTPYVTTSIGELFGPTLNAEITTGGSTSRTFTASGSFVVEGFTKMDVFLVGGGGGVYPFLLPAGKL